MRVVMRKVVIMVMKRVMGDGDERVVMREW